jgi:hypothetical protein
VLALAGVLAAAGPATARAPLPTIVQDDALLLHGSDADVAATLAELRTLGVDDVRVTAQWAQLAPAGGSDTRPSFDASDPRAYAQSAFTALDRVVRLAVADGFGVMMDVGYYAPRWASGGTDDTARATRVDPAAFADFAAMLARRYSGTFAPAGATPLPAVVAFSLWNEPNHPAFLSPQWQKAGGHWVPASPARYRAMVRAAYPAMKAVRSDIAVLIGGTSAQGSYSGRGAGPVPPLRFLRLLACVDGRLRPITTGSCRNFTPIPGDGWTHHPYSLQTLPDAPAPADRPDDVPLGGLDKLTGLLRTLVRMGRLSPGLADVYITEYGYESNPPTTLEHFTVGDQARFLAWSEYLAWRNPAVKLFAQFLLRDTPPAPVPVSSSARRPFGDWSSGLFFADGRPKLAAVAFQAGLFVRIAHHRRVLLWGHVRVGRGLRRVVLQVHDRSVPGWRTLSSEPVGVQHGGGSFETSADGIFQRVARRARDPATRYRFLYADGGSVLASLSVRAVVARAMPAASLPAPL